MPLTTLHLGIRPPKYLPLGCCTWSLFANPGYLRLFRKKSLPGLYITVNQMYVRDGWCPGSTCPAHRMMISTVGRFIKNNTHGTTAHHILFQKFQSSSPLFADDGGQRASRKSHIARGAGLGCHMMGLWGTGHKQLVLDLQAIQSEHHKKLMIEIYNGLGHSVMQYHCIDVQQYVLMELLTESTCRVQARSPSLSPSSSIPISF